MKSSFGIKGTKKLAQTLRKLGPNMLRSAGGSLYRSSEVVMAESRDIYCPVDTGALKSTGKVEFPVYEGGSVTVQMGYGGPAAPYAIHVHEIDKNYNNGKQWKYLETPLKQALPTIARNLVEDLNNDAGEDVSTPETLA